MIRYFTKRSNNEPFGRVLVAPKEDAWIDVSAMTTSEYDSVVDRYGLDPRIVRDVRDMYELPRVEYRNGILYVFTRTVKRTKRGRVASTPLLSIIKESVYLTLSTSDYAPDDILERSSEFKKGDSRALLLATFISVIGQYEELVHKTAHYISTTDQRLRNNEIEDKDFVYFVTIEDNLNDYHTNLSAIVTVLNRLRENKHELFSKDDIDGIDDIVLHINQLLVLISSHTQSIVSIRNAYSTIANNSLNRRMKTLTVLTVLIALPNVVYGMYGMNVALPYADHPWAYFGVIGISLLVIIFTYIVARRLKIF